MERKVLFGEWLNEGFFLLKKEWAIWMLAMLIYFIPIVLIQSIGQAFTDRLILPTGSGTLSLQEMMQQLLKNLTGSIVVGLLTAFAVNFVQAFFFGGLFRMAFKQIQNQEIRINDLFSGLDLFVKILVAAFIITIIEFVAMLFCFIPSLIAKGLLFFTIPLIVRKNAEPVEAIQESFQAAKSEWLMMTLFVFVLNILSVVGIIACCIGILFTFPLLILVNAVAYRDWFEPEMKMLPAIPAYCRYCGARVDPYMTFCNQCGGQLK